jgi:D-inositol-3-phosphate glycosyltransferase
MAARVDRVAFVSMHTSPSAQAGSGDAGGLNVAVLGLAAELALRDVSVELVTRAVGTPRATELLPGVTLHELAAGGHGLLPNAALRAATDEFGEGFAALARRTSVGVVHAHFWLSGLATLPVALELGVPLVQSFHTLSVMNAGQDDASGRHDDLHRSRAENFLAGQADAVVAASSAEAAVLIDGVGASPDRTWIVPPGVDLELFSPVRAKAAAAVRRSFGLEADRPIVAMAGRIQPRKGHELAVRALAELHALHGWAPLLVVAGDPASGEEGFVAALHELAAELGVERDVRWLGALHRDELAELLAAASLVLMPSTSESFGLVALEAGASGTPVVASRVGGLVDAVGPGGALLDTRNPGLWAKELARLLEDDAARATLGVAAREHAERYTWGTAATSLLGIYRALVA